MLVQSLNSEKEELGRNHLINIALAEDHALVRKGIIEVLSTFCEFKIIIEAVDGEDMLTKISKAKKLPDVCILDLNMPKLNGHQTLLELKKKWPFMKVMILSIYDDGFSIIKLIQDGAGAYLSKNIHPKELRKALNALYMTGHYHSGILSGQLFDEATGKLKIPHLTDREIEFLKLCCTQLTYGQIAEKMKISVRTVDSYRDTLFDKLQLNNRAGLVSFAMKTGIITPR